MEPIVSSETSAIRTQTPGNYPKRNKLQLEHGESYLILLRHLGIVDVENALLAGQSGVRIPAEVRDFTLLQTVQTVSSVRPLSVQWV